MGIFKRIKDITTAEIYSVIEKMEDPTKMLGHYIRELEEEIAKGEQALASQIFLEKRQAALISSTEETIAKRSRQAHLAVDREEDQIAKLALQEKLIQQKNLATYKEQYETIQSQTTLLYEKLNKLKQQCDELKHKRLFLISKANAAQSIKQMNQATASFHTDHIARGVARMEERVLMMEAEATASDPQFLADRKPQALAIDPALEEQVQMELKKLKEEKRETA